MKAAGAATAAAGNDEWISNKEAPDPEVLPHLPGYHILIRPVAIREKTKGGILLPDKFKDDVIQYSAGGLRDFTRIAASDPLMWKDIFVDNSDNILKVLENYSKNLNEIKDAIKNKDSKKLLEIFSSTKKVLRIIPSYSFPLNFFGPQTPYALIITFSISANKWKGKLYFFEKLCWLFSESALTPTIE